MSAYCARLKASLTGGIRRSTAATSEAGQHGEEGVRAGREDERERQRDVGQRERVRGAPELQLDRPALGDDAP